MLPLQRDAPLIAWLTGSCSSYSWMSATESSFENTLAAQSTVIPVSTRYLTSMEFVKFFEIAHVIYQRHPDAAREPVRPCKPRPCQPFDPIAYKSGSVPSVVRGGSGGQLR